MRRALTQLVLICCLALSAGASVPDEPVELRRFDAEQVERYRADPAYAYERELTREPSLWERFKEWLAGWLEQLLGSRAGGFMVNNLIYLLIVVALVMAVVLLAKGPLRKVFQGAPRSLGEVNMVEEDIRELDLPAMIAEAERDGDLRRAIRLHYLLVLRLLVDRGVLTWSPRHTDRDYLAQIADPTLRARFAQAARVFQWTWYGHAEVLPARYAELRLPFIQFEQATPA